MLDRGAWLLTHKTLLVKLLADELQEKRIKVNAIFPGGVKSDLLPWTKNLTNEEVPFVTELVTDQQNGQMTGQFFDDHGEVVALSSRKYNANQAKKVLARYL